MICLEKRLNFDDFTNLNFSYIRNGNSITTQLLRDKLQSKLNRNVRNNNQKFSHDHTPPPQLFTWCAVIEKYHLIYSIVADMFFKTRERGK